ncbi:MAG TPA: glycine cleavage T C-terminal barrel domain-containing protein, partial [Pirellulales bacterium]|nr:glycine cleavage T C-terminal barrel domain-containing protein [Pirellulales bacterium]
HVGSLTPGKSPGAERSYWLLVVNASNREKILRWIEPRLDRAPDVEFGDLTNEWAMIAVQGPRAIELLQPMVDRPLAPMKYYTGAECLVAGHEAVVSRTGYTGEDGCELIVRSASAADIWQRLIDAGAVAAGLGARDTLRLEAAMPLYGHELSETINPFTAGLGFAVNLEGRTFPGCETLRLVKSQGPEMVRVGLTLEGKRVAREGDTLERGQITSGTFSPTLGKPIAMAYVPPRDAAPGSRLSVNIRGRAETATVVPLPFYKRK